MRFFLLLLLELLSAWASTAPMPHRKNGDAVFLPVSTSTSGLGLLYSYEGDPSLGPLIGCSGHMALLMTQSGAKILDADTLRLLAITRNEGFDPFKTLGSWARVPTKAGLRIAADRPHGLGGSHRETFAVDFRGRSIVRVSTGASIPPLFELNRPRAECDLDGRRTLSVSSAGITIAPRAGLSIAAKDRQDQYFHELDARCRTQSMLRGGLFVGVRQYQFLESQLARTTEPKRRYALLNLMLLYARTLESQAKSHMDEASSKERQVLEKMLAQRSELRWLGKQGLARLRGKLQFEIDQIALKNLTVNAARNYAPSNFEHFVTDAGLEPEWRAHPIMPAPFGEASKDCRSRDEMPEVQEIVSSFVQNHLNMLPTAAQLDGLFLKWRMFQEGKLKQDEAHQVLTQLEMELSMAYSMALQPRPGSWMYPEATHRRVLELIRTDSRYAHLAPETLNDTLIRLRLDLAGLAQKNK